MTQQACTKGRGNNLVQGHKEPWTMSMAELTLWQQNPKT